ncbi:MAG: FtsX-like permease family protein [Candidatus Syntrophosphaera sp.]
MLKFLIKGIFRDRHRYLFPLVLVSVGIAILVFMLSFITGYIDSFLDHNSSYQTGHVKVVTRSYAEMINLKPIDAALLEIGPELAQWQDAYPQLEWGRRVTFGALLDVPDSTGLTREQGDVAGFAIDILNDPKEVERLKLESSLVTGEVPNEAGEILISHKAFEELGLELGDTVTLIGSTVYGAMAMRNFKVSGSVEFGISALDTGAVVADISDVASMFDMPGGAGEILGFFRHGEYRDREASELRDDFNSRFSGDGEFDPVMLTMMEQNNLGYFMKVMDESLGIMGLVFVILLGIVLWNSGLMNGIRRWGEFGVRLAIGERKAHVYRSLLGEALVIGIVGSIIGIILGGLVSLYFQKNGFDMTAYGQNTTIAANNIINTKINAEVILTAFIPGILATVLGAALAGIAIFKRQTSQLFKELET